METAGLIRGHWRRRLPAWPLPTQALALGALLMGLALSLAMPAWASTPTAGGAGQPRALRGLTLTDALLELEAQGLDIVFTSRVVRPEMRVAAEPLATEPRQRLEEILQPHHLEARQGPGGTLVVVPAAIEAHGGSIAGTVRSREFLEPLAGATIRVLEPPMEVSSTANGRFEIGDLPPGVYSLEAQASGFLPQQVSRVIVDGSRSVDLELSLQPLPFVYDEIAVRPSRLSLLREEPAAPLALSRREIEALPHLGGDVFRALSLLPGVAANDVSAQFHIHGGRRDEVQILLDGQELYDAHHLEDFDNALSIVASEALSSVNLSTGALPANRGDRLSGALDMTTTTPSGPHRLRLSLSLFNALVASTGTFQDGRSGWFATARRGSVDLASRLLGREDPAFWDLFAKVEHRFDGRHQLRAHFLRAGDALDFHETEDGGDKRFDTDYDSTYLWLTHQALLGRRQVVETHASSTTLERDRRGAEIEEEQSFEVLDRRSFDVLGLAQSWGLQASPGHALKWGFELRRYDAGYDYFQDAERNLVLSTELAKPRRGLDRFEGRFHGEHSSVWISDRFSPSAPWTVELGLRGDRHTLTDDTLLSPRLQVARRLGEASVVRLGWGRFYQSQRPYELQVEDGEARFFEAERSEHWVLGYERMLGGGEAAPLKALRLEVYRRVVSDPRPRYENLFEPLNTFPEIEPDRVRIEPDRGHAYGFEMLLRGSAGPAIDWWGTYAYAVAEERIDGERVRRQTDQPHTLRLNLSRHLGRRWRLDVAWRLHTGWPTTPVAVEEEGGPDGETEPLVVLGPLRSERLSTYHRMDLRASRAWQLRSGRLVFFIDVQNLYNRKNLAGFDLSLDEGELVRLEETWTGFFPSVGMSWEL